MADKAHTLTDEKLAEMEKRLSAIYFQSQKEIEKSADAYFDRFTEADAKKRKLLDEGKITEKEYQHWRKGKIMYGDRFRKLKEGIATQLLHVNETATAYINGQLPEVYAINYNSLAPEVDGLGGYSFELTDADTVRDLSLTDKSLLPYKKLNPAKDIPWNMKKINGEVLQGILQGESISKISKRMLNVEEMNKNAAVRTARTIVTGAENKGRQDSYERAESDGIQLKRKWISTHDTRTREWHTELNGKIVGLNEPWENSIGKIMYPGDPTADGANVYNCRCTMVAKVMGFIKEKVEEAKDKAEEVGAKFIPAKTIEEAEKYIKQFVDESQFGALGVSYKGIDVGVANVLNETISAFYNKFNVEAFGGIAAPAGNTKLGKLIENATAAYSPIRKSFLLNRKSLKTMKVAEKSFKAEKEALENLLNHPEKYDFNKISKRVLNVVERSKESGRATVPDNIAEAINHELGHSLESKVFKSELWPKAESNMEGFANKISGYAGENKSEYVAESFASYMKGEKKIDPVLKSIFESLKR